MISGRKIFICIRIGGGQGMAGWPLKWKRSWKTFFVDFDRKSREIHEKKKLEKVEKPGENKLVLQGKRTLKSKWPCLMGMVIPVSMLTLVQTPSLT